MNLLLVAAGGALGAVARHSVGLLLVRLGSGLSIGTFLVNVTGAAILGFLVGSWADAPVPQSTRLFLAVGFLGSFTTFSTFSVEVVTLWNEGATARAVAYGIGSLIAGVAGAIGGLWLASAGRTP